jgi:hypothetical protein
MDRRGQVPPVLYVPCASEEVDEDGPSLDMRRTRDGRTALLVYTALDRLVDCCGELQPWVLVETGKLDAINDAQPYDVIYMDMRIPESERRSGGQS